MRILALVPEAFRGFGGIAQYNRDLITALASSDEVETVRVVPRLAGGPAEETPRKVSQAEPIFSRFLYALAAYRDALRVGPDLIFCGHLYLAILTQYIARLIGAPYVVQLHGTEIWRKPSNAQTRALEKADAILCVSRHTRRKVLQFTRANPNKVLVIPNTVSKNYRPGDRDACRAALGLKDEFVLLTVGRLDAREGYKGHDQIIRMLPRLLKGPRPVAYLISGNGEDRPRLEALVASLSVEEHVRFLGFTPREALPDLYRAADLFVMPSAGEGFGIVFLEAMASGTPALGLAIGGACDPLDFGDWGKAVKLAELDTALCQAMALPRPDADGMRETTAKRFGFGVFAHEAIDQIVGRFAQRSAPSGGASRI